MVFLSNVTNFFTVEGQKEALGRVTNVLNPFQSNPIMLGTSNIDVGAAVRGVVRVGEGALGVAALAAAPVIGLGTKVAIGAGTFVTGGILTSSPKAAAAATKVAKSLPSDITAFGPNIGSFIEDPSFSSAKKIITDSPITSGILATAATVVGAKTIQSALTTQAVREQSQATQDIAESIAKGMPVAATLPTQENKPITPNPSVLPSTPLPEGSPNNPITSPAVGEEPRNASSTCTTLKKRLKYRKAYKVEEYYKRQ